jgi:hypothetical protein
MAFLEHPTIRSFLSRYVNEDDAMERALTSTLLIGVQILSHHGDLSLPELEDLAGEFKNVVDCHRL